MEENYTRDYLLNPYTPKSLSTFKEDQNSFNVSQKPLFNYKVDQTKELATTEDTSKTDIVAKQVKEIQRKLSPKVAKLSDKFIEKVVIMSQRLKCNPEDLLVIMYNESTDWKPDRVNIDKGVKYGGIIQMNNQALNLVVQKYAKEFNLNSKITMTDFLKLSREKQLDYAFAYLLEMKDYCKVSKQSNLKGGKLWAIIKSPKQTRRNNTRFFNKLQKIIDNTKSEIFVEKTNKINIKS